ncbi:MAG: hypothetical protein M3N68_14805 [Actinomycetota bacterium]|nr:hypothetical protein [Actinomycetota bacterium]
MRYLGGPVLVALLGVVIIALLGASALAVPTVAASAALPVASSPAPVANGPVPSVVAAPRTSPRPRTAVVPRAAPPVQEAPPPAPAPVQPQLVPPTPLVPAPLPPVTVPIARGPRAEVVRAVEVLGGLDYPWQRLGFSIVFLAPRRGVLGAAFLEERRIEIYVRPEQEKLELAHVIAHEIGHAVDFTYGTSARRAEWMRLRGLDPAWPWPACPGCPDYATPAGDFAEVFAYWLAGPDSGFKGRLAGPPLPADLEVLTPFFWP